MTDPRAKKLATLFAPQHLLEYTRTPQNQAAELIAQIELTGLRVIDPDSAIDIIAREFDWEDWDRAHAILNDPATRRPSHTEWANDILRLRRARARKLLEALQKSEQ